MKILLLGEYSNVHWTLAEGLRALGHKVTVVSNGDFWKDYPRDISLVRGSSRLSALPYVARLLAVLPRLRGYDVVQLINPVFLDLKAARILPVYRYLRRWNKKVVLCAAGMDYYWVKTCTTAMPLRYSDFNLGPALRTNADALRERREWLGTDKQRLNELIAQDCDGIVAGLYEYWVCYEPVFPKKTTFIPFPIRCDYARRREALEQKIKRGGPLKVFIGINRTRSEYKGTDIMLRAAQDVAARHPEDMELEVVESLPFAEYTRRMEGSDAILDQLYSYTPSMNPLEAMSKGIVCIGGGEPENYEILGEERLRPIVNVEPNYESVCEKLERLVAHPERLPQLQRDSISYIEKHHDYMRVARLYENFYKSL